MISADAIIEERIGPDMLTSAQISTKNSKVLFDLFRLITVLATWTYKARA